VFSKVFKLIFRNPLTISPPRETKLLRARITLTVLHAKLPSRQDGSANDELGTTDDHQDQLTNNRFRQHKTTLSMVSILCQQDPQRLPFYSPPDKPLEETSIIRSGSFNTATDGRKLRGRWSDKATKP
jgi:hypothetical protein